MGSDAEKRFVSIFEAIGHKVTKSTRIQDMREHWDFMVNGRSRIEVKARKKLRRHNADVADSVLYVEFKNVAGYDGWMYGKADFMAFECEDGFMLVKRSDLVKIAETLVPDMWSSRPMLYHRYKRRDRPAECVGLIKFSDLLTIPHKLVK